MESTVTVSLAEYNRLTEEIKTLKQKNRNKEIEKLNQEIEEYKIREEYFITCLISNDSVIGHQNDKISNLTGLLIDVCKVDRLGFNLPRIIRKIKEELKNQLT